jgi:hypothetical protein
MSGRVKLTPSGAESAIRCRWRHYLETFCGYIDEAVLQNQYGIAHHAFIAGLHKPKQGLYEIVNDVTPRFRRENLSEQWNNFWTEHLRNIRGALVPREVLERFIDHGRRQGTRFIELYLAHPRSMDIEGAMVEVSFENVHIPGTSVDLNVRLDQIRRSRHEPYGDILVDLKFSETNHFDPKENLALQCYALAYRLELKKIEHGVSIWNVPSGFDKEAIKVAHLTNEDMIATTNTLRQVGLNIINRKFNLSKDDVVCQTCPTKAICRAPGRSIALHQLASQNTRHKGPLPNSRSELIAERILEVPEGKPPYPRETQAELGI